ncbi:MAG: RNA polymerase sigma factor [Acidimicrobiales bacterium]
MPETASKIAAAVADAHRREWGFVLAATVRVTRNLDLAEECVQDAYAKALTSWAAGGLPDKPGAWLTTVARRRAIDLIRSQATLDRKLPLLAGTENGWLDRSEGLDGLDGLEGAAEVSDDRLKLIFTCCHPALGIDSQVALTLRLLCGLTTREVARAFLVSEPTMAARITRAKKKIAAARIPYRVPAEGELAERLQAALAVVHLLFTTGHSAPRGHLLVRNDLVERALDLARMLRVLLPESGDVAGLLAIVLLTDARRSTRVGERGQLLLLEEQDRRAWDGAAIAEGVALVREALAKRPPSRYALQAAIAAVHCEAPSWEETDWSEIVALYGELVAIWPSPVVELNRAVARGMASGPEAGLVALGALAGEPQLAGYGYLPAARAGFLRHLGRSAEARASYEEALSLTENEVERRFLMERIGETLQGATERSS